jgi:peroxiredoxin
MDVALLVLRLLLAVVLAVAGIAKLADRRRSASMLRDFGFPAAWAPTLGVFLPLAEVATALALLPVTSARYGAAAALGLLIAFCAAIGVNLVRGRTPDCQCFGQIHSGPVGWPTLARNGVFAIAAALVVWYGWGDPGPSAMGWLDALTGADWVWLVGGTVVLALVATQSWLLVQLLGQHGRLLMRLDALESRFAASAAPAMDGFPEAEAGLPIGSPAPKFALVDLNGVTYDLDALRAPGKSILLVFSDPGCGTCNALLPEIVRWQQQHAKKVTLAVISRGTPETGRARRTEHMPERVLLQREREVMEAYQAYWTPSAIMVRPDGAIGSSLAKGAPAIRALVARTAGAPLSHMLSIGLI